MQIEVTGRKIELTPAIKERAHSAFDKLNEHFSAINARLIFEKDGREFRAHTEYRIDNGDFFSAESLHEDLYQAIDEACGKLRVQLQSNKRVH
jgi:ribosomal subunit interface protein